MSRSRIVILGGGFSGAYCAQALEKKLKGADVEILLIDSHNYFIFYPLLVEAGTGSLEPRHAVISIRSFVKDAIFRMGTVIKIDPAANAVTYQLVGKETTDTIAYDHLVLAMGSVSNRPPIPGLREWGFDLKNLADAITLRDRAIQLLELADATPSETERRELLHFVVVGGNFTGVEVAGEFQVFLRQASRYYRNVKRDEIKFTLIERSERILNQLDDDLAYYAEDRLQKRGVRIIKFVTAKEIHRDRVVLTNGETLATRTLIWCAGIAQHPLLRATMLPADERGYILCERDTRVKGHDNIWGIGDCAVNPGPDGAAYPATAQHAVREGAHLARNLAHVLRGEPTVPCDIKFLGSLTPIGCRTAVAKILNIKLSGFIAWFVWRTVYLLKMPGWSRRFRVAADWTLDMFWRREYVQLGLHRRFEMPQAEKRPDGVAEEEFEVGGKKAA